MTDDGKTPDGKTLDGKTLADFMPKPEGVTVSADGTTFQARAGQALNPGESVTSEDGVIDALKTVYDPELPVNLYDLGLIYRHDVAADGNVDIDMTLTAPGCPVAGEMPGMVAEAVAKAEGVGEVLVTLVWDPPWDKSKMSEDAQFALGMF